MSAQTVDHYPISLHFHGRQQPAHPPLAHPHLLGRPSLRHLSVSDAFQPIQPVAFLLAHRDTFHPSSLAAVKRNFLLCPIRNFSHCRDRLLTTPFPPTEKCDRVQTIEVGLLILGPPRRSEIGRASCRERV